MAGAEQLKRWLNTSIEESRKRFGDGTVPEVNAFVALGILDRPDLSQKLDADGENFSPTAVRSVSAKVSADERDVHLIAFRPDGWTVRHPQICRDGDLFSCRVSWNGDARPAELGVYEVELAADGSTVLGQRVADL
jgi:hypothetical protein